jgi:hypothetical protein
MLKHIYSDRIHTIQALIKPVSDFITDSTPTAALRRSQWR